MKNEQLKYLSIFIQVAKLGGFRSAAKELNMGASSVSEAILRLENSLGVRLFQRTTRKISLTDIGQNLYDKSLPAIESLENSLTLTYNESGAVTGELSINASQGVCSLFLNSILTKFSKIYPEVIIHLDCESRKKDLVKSKIDIAVRLNKLLDPETYAVPIGPPLNMAVIASPSYLSKNGIPKKPEDLINFDGIVFSLDKTEVVPWTFNHLDNPLIVKPRVLIKTNNMQSVIKFTEDGLGFSYVYQDLINDHKVVEVLESFKKKKYQYSLNYLNNKNIKPSAKALINFVKNMSYI